MWSPRRLIPKLTRTSSDYGSTRAHPNHGGSNGTETMNGRHAIIAVPWFPALPLHNRPIPAVPETFLPWIESSSRSIRFWRNRHGMSGVSYFFRPGSLIVAEHTDFRHCNGNGGALFGRSPGACVTPNAHTPRASSRHQLKRQFEKHASIRPVAVNGRATFLFLRSMALQQERPNKWSRLAFRISFGSSPKPLIISLNLLLLKPLRICRSTRLRIPVEVGHQFR